ncbi:MAG: histone H1/H5 family protein, partial [Planctomycetota bacterium]|nr:histone H1/H5 family protein [Planctomycetota bacterium]
RQEGCQEIQQVSWKSIIPASPRCHSTPPSIQSNSNKRRSIAHGPVADAAAKPPRPESDDHHCTRHDLLGGGHAPRGCFMDLLAARRPEGNGKPPQPSSQNSQREYPRGTSGAIQLQIALKSHKARKKWSTKLIGHWVAPGATHSANQIQNRDPEARRFGTIQFVVLKQHRAPALFHLTMTFEQNIISAIDSQKGWMSRPAIKTYLAKNCGFVDTPMNKVHLKKALAKFEKKGDSYKVKKTQRKTSVNKEQIAVRKAKIAAKKLALKQKKAAKKAALAAKKQAAKTKKLAKKAAIAAKKKAAAAKKAAAKAKKASKKAASKAKKTVKKAKKPVKKASKKPVKKVVKKSNK